MSASSSPTMQESQDLFGLTIQESQDLFSQSPSLLLLASTAVGAENGIASSTTTPPLPMSKPEKVKIQPIILKRSGSDVANVRKKRRTAAQLKDEEVGLGQLQSIQQASGSNWYNAGVGGMAAAVAQPQYPLAADFQFSTPPGSTTSTFNWKRRGVAILQTAASLGNAWANAMSQKLKEDTATREEMNHIYNVVLYFEQMLNVFKSE